MDTNSTDEESTAEDIFDTGPPTGTFFFADALVKARKQAGRGAFGVLADVIWLSIKKRKMMNAQDYFTHRMFELGPDKKNAMLNFIADEERATLNRAINFRTLSDHVITDKFFLEIVLRRFGIPVATTQNVFIDRTMPLPGHINERAVAKEFLRNEAKYPIFCKPADSSMSLGVASIEFYDNSDDTLVRSGGGRTDLSTFVEAAFDTFGEKGYLIQRKLRPHPALREVCGDTVGCARIVTVTENGRTEPLYAMWKIPAVGAIADNLWREGNMRAEIDVESGEVLRCFRGNGVDREVIEEHPDTERSLLKLQLPDWEKTLEVVRQAGGLMKNTVIIGWDVAMCEQGPVIVEANNSPDHGLHQLATGVGIFSTEAGNKLKALQRQAQQLIEDTKSAKRRAKREHMKKRRERALAEGFKVND